MIRKKYSVIVFCAFLVMLAFPAQSKDFNLKPTTKWLMDYAPDSCRLMRAFGDDRERLVVQFIGYQPTEDFEFNLIGAPASHDPSSEFVSVRFGAEGPFARRRAFSGGADGAPALFLAARLDNGGADGRVMEMGGTGNLLNNPRRFLVIDDDTGAPVAEATLARVQTATVLLGRRTVTLELGPMAGPMAAMHKCTADLVKEWGFDPAQQAALASRPEPIGDVQSWLRAVYSTPLALDRERALVRFRLMIDSAGKPTSCVVQSRIEVSDHFSGPGCNALMGGRFKPARLPGGEAVASYYTLRAAWYLNPSSLDQRVLMP